MEQPALWLSTTYLTVKFAAALWAGQLATILLTRGQSNLGRSMALAILSIPVAIQAWRTPSSGAPGIAYGPVTASTLWLVAALLAAMLLIDCLRRWLASSDRAKHLAAAKDRVSEPSVQRFSTSALMLSIVGLLVTLLAIIATLSKPTGLSTVEQRLALGQIVCWVVMSGVTIATTLELTLGKTGPALAQQAWRAISYLAVLGLIGQIAISLMIILRLRASESIEEAAMPILYAIGMTIVAYIVWAIPNRVATHAAKPPFRDHISLALAGWIALMCLALAATLPADWPKV